MNKLLIAFILSAPMLLLSGCAVDTVTYSTVGYGAVGYDPLYNNDYVYSVGYYSNGPYWTGYGIGDYGYWGTYGF